MKKTITLFILLLIIHSYLSAQSISPQVIASNGTFASANGYSLSYTTGQPASATFTRGASIITQGFQQPNDVYTGLQTVVTPTLTAQLYPNPAADQINLVISSSNRSTTYTVQMVDLLGRVIEQPQTTQATNGQTRFVFNVQPLPPAMYFITIKSADSDVMYSFKFNKVN